MSGIPIILCGKTEQIGTGVIANLKPEFDVIHFVMTVESGVEEIPYVLKGQQPPSRGSHIGSSNYGAPPRAVVFGGAFDDAAFDAIRTSWADVQIPLLRVDVTIPMPPVGPEYGKKILQRCKSKLTELEKDGKLDGSHGGIILY
ncbi:hypothetical protein BX600DRAFT_139333 [Xylariales sp. PMI_506]|nr:hypothetical protein BX600DRAFT_139333 [Xylariales sp. PMI_506]